MNAIKELFSNLTPSDRPVAKVVFGILIVAGLAGGADHFNTPDNFAQYMSLLILPGLAVWFGRRAPDFLSAIKISAAFGAALFLPALIFLWSERFSDTLFAAGIMVLLPTIIGAGSWSMRNVLKLGDDATSDTVKRNSRILGVMGVVGFIVFPQLVQPIVLDAASQLKAKVEASGVGGEHFGPAKFGRLAAIVSLSIVALGGLLSTLMAVADAIL